MPVVDFGDFSFKVKDDVEFNTYLRKKLKPAIVDDKLVFNYEGNSENMYVLDYLYNQSLKNNFILFTNKKILESPNYIDYVVKLKKQLYDEIDIKLYPIKIYDSSSK